MRPLRELNLPADLAGLHEAKPRVKAEALIQALSDAGNGIGGHAALTA